MFSFKLFFSCLGGAEKRHERISMPSSEPTYQLCRLSRCGAEHWCGGEANDTAGKTLQIASKANSSESVDYPGDSQTWSLHRLLKQPPVKCHLKLVTSMQELLSGIYLEQKSILSGHDSVVWKGVWHGAMCNVKFLRVSSLTPDLLTGIDLLITQSHPFILQYYLARAVRVHDGSWWQVVDGPAQRPRSDDVNADSESMGIESILGSTLFGTKGDEYSSFREPETVESVLEILQPKPGDFIIALITEMCILGNIQRAISGRYFEHSNQLGAHAALRTAREIALGLMHLHLRGAAHGNLRPSQILLVESHADRRGFIAKIADAGLGSRHRLCQTPTAHTAASDGEGTAGSLQQPQPPPSCYTAPELLQAGYGVIGEGFLPKLTIAELQAADVYSFGCLFYEILSGGPPLHVLWGRDQQPPLPTGEPPKEVSRAVDFPLTPADQPFTWASSCDPHMRRLCCRCLSKDPQRRPAFAAVLTELNAIEAKMRIAAAGTALSAGADGCGAGEDPLRPPDSVLHSQGAHAYVPLAPILSLCRNSLNGDSSSSHPEPQAQTQQQTQPLTLDFDEQRRFEPEQSSGPLWGYGTPYGNGNGSPSPSSARWKGLLGNAGFNVPAAQTGLDIIGRLSWRAL